MPEELRFVILFAQDALQIHRRFQVSTQVAKKLQKAEAKLMAIEYQESQVKICRRYLYGDRPPISKSASLALLRPSGSTALISKSGSSALATERNYNSSAAATPQRKTKKVKKAKKETVEEALTATKQVSKTSQTKSKSPIKAMKVTPKKMAADTAVTPRFKSTQRPSRPSTAAPKTAREPRDKTPTRPANEKSPLKSARPKSAKRTVE